MSDYKEYQVKNGLNKYIDCVWRDDFNKYLGNGDKKILVVPDNTIELAFTSNSVERTAKHSKKKICKIKSHLCGLKTEPQLVGLEGDVLLSVRFKPYGLYPFTKTDINKTINESLLPEDIFGKEILVLEEQLFNTSDELEQVKFIEDFFLKKLNSNNKEVDHVFNFFIQNIILNKGNVNVDMLAEKCNVSKKTVERKFLSKLGLTPKKYCRIVRMFNALKIPKNKKDLKLSSIAFDNGFYDQAHFIKEVKEFTGMTPKNYFDIDRTVQTNIFLH
ncbi:helix-turn-helix transcriptional regulator [Pontimicrobium aquaticum]|uniref:Helix-turn-helix transcriptional regulator n=1 Tax=Pontimicrobium aquaticum TaxID=2565367 RepID=A0A4U0EYE3_9FLAO|nr:helix-turn-helix transcriptional regulator [Pontimicrobium aquaticum]TJY37055.1 helix-turn-helix transcriptional regulator [Pontimicrobium aquaticum]